MKQGGFNAALLAPRYWLLWLGFGVWWCLAQLPYPVIVQLGKALGGLLFLAGGRRKKIARRNLELCFPELSGEQCNKLLRDNFRCYGLAFFEVGIAWWWSNKRFRKIVRIEGLEHLENLNGQGALLTAIHLTTLEIGAAAVSLEVPACGMHRPHKNPVYEYVQIKGREKRRPGNKLYSRDDVRGALKALRQGEILWYAPDQDYGIKQGVFAPFMGVNAATITATARFASAGKAKIIPLTQQHLPGFKGYKVTVHPPLEGFPVNDDYRDAVTINMLAEEFIRLQPQSYLWVHRRFKTRPNGEASLYQ